VPGKQNRECHYEPCPSGAGKGIEPAAPELGRLFVAGNCKHRSTGGAVAGQRHYSQELAKLSSNLRAQHILDYKQLTTAASRTRLWLA
jgi:hypothetical protein